MLSNNMEDELMSKGNQMVEFVEMGLGVGDTLLDGLKRFFNVLKGICADEQTRDLKKAYKALQGREFKLESEFILNAKQTGTHDFANATVSNAELKEFKKLCKQYGIDYLYQKRPDNLDELYSKKVNNQPLSSTQAKVVDAFTYTDINGILKIKNDCALITFSANDLEIMSKVVDKLEERTFNIEKRKAKAERIVKQTKANKIAEKFTKGLKKNV